MYNSYIGQAMVLTENEEIEMFTVIQKEIPARKRLLGNVILPAVTVFVVVDSSGEESWQCALRVTAEMYAACKNRDAIEGVANGDKNGTLAHFEGCLNDFLNS